MHRWLAQPLDQLSMRLAARTVQDAILTPDQLHQAQVLLRHPQFGGPALVAAPADLRLHGNGQFSCSSALPGRWPRNNRIPGRFQRCGADWQQRPAVVLVHGWNAEGAYDLLFPLLERRFQAAGVNVLSFELPYHRQRRPAPDHGRQPPHNFLSGDLLHVVGALQQAVADTRSLVSWLRLQGIQRVGLWGISLGGWLGGMLACVEPQLAAAVLMTPVVRLDRTIAEALFCAPLRRSLNGARPDVSPLNLVTHRPQLSPGRILVVACEHDLFAPIAAIEELQAAWNQPLTWRLPHGHISVLFSPPVMRRTVSWLVNALAAR